MLFSELITELRYELDDTQSTRWTDAKLLSFLKRAIRRTYNIAINAHVKYLRGETTVTTEAGTSLYNLPSDCATVYNLYDSNGETLEHLNDDRWHRATLDNEPNTYWRMNGTQVEVGATPQDAADLTLVYYKKFDNTATTTSTVPLEQLQDLYIDYAAMRAKNVDEMSLNSDMTFLREWESNILSRLQQDEPSLLRYEGRQL